MGRLAPGCARILGAGGPRYRHEPARSVRAACRAPARLLRGAGGSRRLDRLGPGPATTVAGPIDPEPLSPTGDALRYGTASLRRRPLLLDLQVHRGCPVHQPARAPQHLGRHLSELSRLLCICGLVRQGRGRAKPSGVRQVGSIGIRGTHPPHAALRLPGLAADRSRTLVRPFPLRRLDMDCPGLLLRPSVGCRALGWHICADTHLLAARRPGQVGTAAPEAPPAHRKAGPTLRQNDGRGGPARHARHFSCARGRRPDCHRHHLLRPGLRTRIIPLRGSDPTGGAGPHRRGAAPVDRSFVRGGRLRLPRPPL